MAGNYIDINKRRLSVINDELARHLAKIKLLPQNSECLAANPNSERRHSNKNCRLLPKAKQKQSPVTFFKVRNCNGHHDKKA